MADQNRNDVRGEQERDRDPTQIALPNIDTSIEVSETFTFDDLVALVPAFGVAIIGLSLYVLGLPAIILGATAVLTLAVAVAGMLTTVVAHEFTSAEEILTGLKRYFLLRREMPVSTPVAARLRHHNVRRIFDDGTAEMDDGTLVGLRRVNPRNTDNMDFGELDPMVATLSKNIDERVKDFDFNYYSTSRDHDISETIENYDRRAYNGVLDRAGGYLGEYARSLVEWFEEVNEPGEDPNEMYHYVVVRVEPDDSELSARSRSSDGSRIPFVGSDDGDDDLGFRRRKEMQSVLYDRLGVVRNKMFAGIDGITVDRVSPEEHAEVLLAFWTGEQHEPDDRLERKFNRGGPGPSAWPESKVYATGDTDDGREAGGDDVVGSVKARKRLQGAFPDGEDDLDGTDRELAGSHFDAQKGYLEVGDQLVTTLWVTDFRPQIESAFLKPLYSMEGIDGVDLDITIDTTAIDKSQAREEIQEGEANIGAKSGEQTRIESRETDEGGSIYETADDLLRNTNAQAWDVSMYVSVRVGPRGAIDTADDDFRDFDSLDAAKHAALQDGIEDVKETVEASPIEATVIRPQRLQKELLDSVSPNKSNTFNDVLADDDAGMIERRIETLLGDAGTSGPKQNRVLGGFLGAAFPPCCSTINEDGGLNWGRDVETGEPFRTDPSSRDTGPHYYVLGVTRGGKTYAISSAAAGWFTEKDDRTLIVCDTKGGFDGLTRMLGGDHHVIEGSQKINPLETHSPSEGNEDVDAFWMSVTSRTNFFKNILRGQGIDPSKYHSEIEQGLEETYRRFDVVPGDVEPSGRMPTVKDLKKTWTEMAESPEEFTASGEGSKEGEVKETRVAELLNKLSGFSEGGRYHNLLGETSLGILDSDTDMAYLDMSQLASDSDAEKSAMLSLAQSLVNQKVRQTDGELMFVVDEAHLLLHSDEQVNWLQRAAREWAESDGILGMISQDPSEFLDDNSDGNSGKKRALLNQCSMRAIFNMPSTKANVIGEFVPGANHGLVDTIQNDLTPARADAGYTECVVNVTDNDRPGWHRVKVEASKFEDYVFDYDHGEGEDGDFDEYMARFLHGNALAPIERDQQNAEDEQETDEQPAEKTTTDFYADVASDD